MQVNEKSVTSPNIANKQAAVTGSMRITCSVYDAYASSDGNDSPCLLLYCVLQAREGLMATAKRLGASLAEAEEKAVWDEDARCGRLE